MHTKSIILSGGAAVAAVLFAACSSDPAGGTPDGGTGSSSTSSSTSSSSGDGGGSSTSSTSSSSGDGGGSSSGDSGNPCATAGCSADATCSVVGGAAKCECKGGFTGDGKTCTKVVNCAGSPCKNGATCADNANTDAGTAYTCTCAPGYSGTNCDTNINECAGNPCKNGGNCTDGVNKFTCACAPGYTGDTCETNIDECNPNPCMNGGSCTDGVNAYTCACINGFSGTKCDVAPYPTTNLMAYWNFEQAQGTVTDQSGNNNNAVGVTATRDNGRLGFGYTFAGGQCIGFANSATLNMGGKLGFTGMLWEKYTVNGGASGIFFNQENTYEFAVGVNGANNLNDAMPFPAGWAWFGDKVLTKDVWQHIAVTWDGAKTRHYVDGVESYSRNQGGTFTNNASNGFGIGCRGVPAAGTVAATGGQFFTGTIDEMFIYDRALTAQEISTYYNATKP